MKHDAPLVLIVDDDPAINTIISFILSAQGFKTYSAYNKVDAINLLKQHHFPLMLLDLGLPPNEHSPKNGLELLRWCQDYRPDCLIIVLTGQDDTAYDAIHLGAFDYLNKPVDEQSITAAFQRALLFHQQKSKMKEAGLHEFKLQATMGEGVKNVRNLAEEKILKQILYHCDFNVHEAARILGLKRENVYYLMKKYDLNREEDIL